MQQAREAARRSSCKNNLKQIGLALHNYHDTHSVFPPGFIDAGTTGQDSGFSWQAFVLPQMEQAPLYEQFNFSFHPFGVDGGGHGGSIAANRQACSATLESMSCPSDIKPDTTSIHTSMQDGHIGNIATSSYAGVIGSYNGGPCSGGTPYGNGSPRELAFNNGILGVNTSTRMRDITDGTSSTAMAGEIRWLQNGVGSQNNSLYGSIASGGQARCDYIEGDPSRDQSAGPFRHLRATRHVVNIAGTNDERGRAFASFHTGGAQFLFADGSVHFLSENINHTNKSYDAANPFGNGAGANYGIYQRIASMNDGRTVDF